MRLLIIEDDRADADYMARAFRELGHSADLAADGEAGLAHALASKYDVIIVDRRLPKPMALRSLVLCEVKKKVRIPYPNNSGALTTGGGLVFTGFTDGSFMAYDDTTLEQLWKINVGTGFNAPPMTFEVNGKQYVAILSGLSPISKVRHNFTPELREQRNQTMLFVFSL